MKRINLLLFVYLLTFVAYAQKTPPQNWFLLDAKKDKYPGVSANKAYNELLKGKPAKTVVVAVIDGGTDVSQKDLKEVIWVNEKEIPGNGIDDDKNGYIDDVNGWSFIGGKDSDVVEDTYELTRMYALLKPKYKDADTTKLSAQEKADYYLYQEVKKEFRKKSDESTRMTELMIKLTNAINQMKAELKTDSPTLDQIKKYNASSPVEVYAQKAVIKTMEKGATLKDLESQLKEGYDYYSKGTLYSFNLDFNSRTRVGDNLDDMSERYYGNNHVSGPKGEHGTHVAGIIGAVRNNDFGIDGIAAHVKIMVLRVVPDGDERDKDVANAIRYAANNGAQVINMSFGKNYSPYKYLVDDAVKFAESKDVLIVHAAGNDAKNTDIDNNFPRDKYLGTSTYASNWLEVGASSWKKRKYRAAEFSNYGTVNVDVFAPGVAIYSTLPNNSFASYNGTSMASPVTAGVAALIRSYYPTLTAQQVKEVIMESAVPVKRKVFLPGNDKKKVKMKELCITGGLVNAYAAVLLAEKKVNGK